ncbi:hypothetical protein YO5_09390 [Stutzerimonas stutzeri TS44]|nr:hypothetical protein YO5_09390 [Stutzerimonas stutzeri TS44]
MAGGTWFFTVTLADRRSALLVEQIDRLRAAYREAQSRLPFHTVAICVLPEHLHTIWTLPHGDSDFAGRTPDPRRGGPAAACRLPALQPGQAWLVYPGGRLAVLQLSPLR